MLIKEYFLFVKASAVAINAGSTPEFIYVLPNNSKIFLLNRIAWGEGLSGFELKAK